MTLARFTCIVAGILLLGSVAAAEPPRKRIAPPDEPQSGSIFGRGGAIKKAALAAGGGTMDTEAAVTAGLRWIVSIQGKNGSWDLAGTGKFKDGGLANDVAGTALALLPFLGAGRTHKLMPPEERENEKTTLEQEKAYSAAILKGLQFLIKIQDKKKGALNNNMYAHGLATIVLCEAYALTEDADLRNAAQLAVNYIQYAQHGEGGWRYGPKEKGDISVSGWQIMALKTAQMAGLDVQEAVLKKVPAFLDQVCDRDSEGYGYLKPAGEVTPARTAIGLLCRQHIQSWGPRNDRMQRGAKILRVNPASLEEMYYTYYAAQALYHLGGPEWADWNEKMTKTLLDGQVKAPGALAGSWGMTRAGAGPASHVSGRLMQTSLCLCTLEVYYRHLPFGFRAPKEKD